MSANAKIQTNSSSKSQTDNGANAQTANGAKMHASSGANAQSASDAQAQPNSNTQIQTSNSAKITRRTFLGFVGACAGCAAVGGVGVAFAGNTDMLRPPGGQDEKAFLSACLRCDRCRSVCPTGAISLSSVDDGFLQARTPTFNFHRGYCDFCGKCQEVCAVGALGIFDPEKDKIGVAIVQRDRCLAFTKFCESCKESCNFGALTFDSANHPTIDGNLCNGCGACEDACTALVYGSFSGGTRRGIVVESVNTWEKLGTTLVSGEGA